MGMEIATLAGGCFWCVEAVYRDLIGVEAVISGYMGGSTDAPTYPQVCTGETGHAEIIQVSFDPAVISYAELLGVFFTTHDPTQLNRQGNDVGTQYRSAVFYHSELQRAEAEKAKTDAAKIWDDPIVTEITEASIFWSAGDDHQDYFANNPDNPYCMAVVAPKVTKARQKFHHLLKP